MGQTIVRQAVTDFLTYAVEQGIIPLVGQVYSGRTYIFESDYEINAANAYVGNTTGDAAVLVVNLVGPDRRTRVALAGRTANYDMNVHPVVIEIFFASRSGNPLTAQQSYDTIVDAIVPLIRANPTLNSPVFANPSAIWSAGEYSAGVVHQQTEPFTAQTGTTVFIVGEVQFEAWEQIVIPEVVPL